MTVQNTTSGVLSRVRSALARDFRAVRERDPALHSPLELLMYQGLHAVWIHRLGHALYRADMKVGARLVSQVGRFLTGIEIHPGATLGNGVFIDHGMGVVIGETAEVGDDVTIYQGVTLGGTGKQGGKRHPTIGDRVVVGTGAQVLGAITVGEDAKIGAGSIVVRDVPPRSTVVGNPGRPVIIDGRKVAPDDANGRLERLPDPVADVFRSLMDCIERLDAEVNVLREGGTPPPRIPGADCMGRAERQVKALTQDEPMFYGDGAHI